MADRQDDDRQEQDRPTQAGPARQRDLDAQSRLRNDPFATADHQTGLDAAADRNAALGDSTGNARRTTGAAGNEANERTAGDAQQALRESRGNREERDVTGRD